MEDIESHEMNMDNLCWLNRSRVQLPIITPLLLGRNLQNLDDFLLLFLVRAEVQTLHHPKTSSHWLRCFNYPAVVMHVKT